MQKYNKKQVLDGFKYFMKMNKIDEKYASISTICNYLKYLEKDNRDLPYNYDTEQEIIQITQNYLFDKYAENKSYIIRNGEKLKFGGKYFYGTPLRCEVAFCGENTNMYYTKFL